jgi:hypothetical protein
VFGPLVSLMQRLFAPNCKGEAAQVSANSP